MVEFKKVEIHSFQQPDKPWEKVQDYDKIVDGYTLKKYTRRLGSWELVAIAFKIIFETVPSMLCNYDKGFWPSKSVCRLWKQVFITQTESIRFGFKISYCDSEEENSEEIREEKEEEGGEEVREEKERSEELKEEKEKEQSPEIKKEKEEAIGKNDTWKPFETRPVHTLLSPFTTSLKDLEACPHYEAGWDKVENVTLAEIGTIKHLKYPYKTKKARESSHSNRYPNILPYDENIPEGVYVNASEIKYQGLRRIATQGPIGTEEGRGIGTVGDFLSMVLHRHATILCLTNHVENEKTKCAHYWHPEVKSFISNNLSCRVDKENRIISARGDQSLVEYTLNVFDESKDGEIVHRIRMIHYQNWQDYTPPDLELANHLKQEIGPEELVVSHCSAGVGRTGTFTAIECICKDIDDQLEHGVPLPDVQVNIPNTVFELRRQRYGMVQTEGQYKAIVDFIIAYYKSKAEQF